MWSRGTISCMTHASDAIQPALQREWSGTMRLVVPIHVYGLQTRVDSWYWALNLYHIIILIDHCNVPCTATVIICGLYTIICQLSASVISTSISNNQVRLEMPPRSALKPLPMCMCKYNNRFSRSVCLSATNCLFPSLYWKFCIIILCCWYIIHNIMIYWKSINIQWNSSIPATIWEWNIIIESGGLISGVYSYITMVMQLESRWHEWPS